MKLGKEIDEFDGKVARFNSYVIKDYEDYVGTRTDYWITCGAHKPHFIDYEDVFLVSYARHRDSRLIDTMRKRYPDCDHFPDWAWEHTTKLMNLSAPSSGAVAAGYFQRDYEVYLYGFDFFSGKNQHYGDKVDACHHNSAKEKEYFRKLIADGRVIPFHNYLYNMEEQAKYDWLYAGGCPSYGTYDHGKLTHPLIEELKPKTLLDVGCGMGRYVKWCLRQGIKAEGVDIASGYGIKADVCDLPYGDESFEIVTVFDLLEHLSLAKLETALDEIKRVAEKYIIVSIGYGPSMVKHPTKGNIDLHQINDKNQDWWLEQLGKLGRVSLWGKDRHTHPYIFVQKELQGE